MFYSNNLFASLQGPAPPASVKLKSGFSGNVSLGMTLSAGTYKVRTFNFNLVTYYNIPQNLIIFNSYFNYGSINYNGEKYIENTNNFSISFKHLLFFHSGGKSYTFYGMQDQSDKFNGYWNIFGVESGMGYNILETRKLTLRCELGIDYSQIRYTINPEENIVSGMSFFHISYKPSNVFSGLFETKYLTNLQYPKLQDYRVDDLFSLIFTITTKISLKTDLNLNYINRPPLVYPVDEEGRVIPGSHPEPAKRVYYSLIQSIMVKF